MLFLGATGGVEASARRLYPGLTVGSPNFGRFIQHTSENSSGLVARTIASLNHSFAQHSLPVEE
jgi:hypothetical protein